MHDRLGGVDRRAIRLLTCVDVFTRECLALEVAPGFRAGDVINVLSKIVAKRGRPQAIRCDNGTEFTATAFDQWAYANSIAIDYSRPGKPTDNAFIESFNGRVRQELLNAFGLILSRSPELQGDSGAATTARNDRTDRWATKPRKSMQRKRLGEPLLKSHNSRLTSFGVPLTQPPTSYLSVA